jgi:hypothetical protein
MIKRDDRFRITSYASIEDALAKEPKRVIARADIPRIREVLQANWGAIRTPVSCSLSDIFLACQKMLCGADSHTCGKVYGFLEAPYAIVQAVTLKRADIVASAKTIGVERFLPSRIRVGDTAIGPADWMRAALDVLCGYDEVTLSPSPALPSLEVLPQLKDLSLRGWVQSDDFEDRYLSDRLRYQSWTMRYLSKGCEASHEP